MPHNIYHLDPNSALGKAMTEENLAFLERSRQIYGDNEEYDPENDYVYIPVSETDPWFTSDHIKIKHTSGGEYFIKRNDGRHPTNFAETYNGPYFTWMKEPEYNGNDALKQTFGRLGDHVIGESYYGAAGLGKPKYEGLAKNQVLDISQTYLRAELGGMQFANIDGHADPNLRPLLSNMTNAEIKVAQEANVHIDQVVDASTSLPDAINVKSWGDKKYIHITQKVNLESGLSVLQRDDTNMTQLAPTEQRFGMKGRAPVITNQPNFRVDWDNQPL